MVIDFRVRKVNQEDRENRYVMTFLGLCLLLICSFIQSISYLHLEQLFDMGVNHLCGKVKLNNLYAARYFDSFVEMQDCRCHRSDVSNKQLVAWFQPPAV